MSAGLSRLRRPSKGRSGGGFETPSTEVLLVELPFKTFSRPSLGLSLLKAALEDRGHRAVIRYANIEFAAAVGLRLYRILAEEVPEPLLLGDLVFAPLVDPSRGSFEELRRRGGLFLQDGSPMGTVPDEVWDALPRLQREAAAFTAHLASDLARSSAPVIGFSCMFQTLPSMAVAKALRALAPEKIIIAGGPHFEGDMGLALHEAYPFLDYVARGEGEALIADFADAIACRDSTAHIAGLVRREDGKSVATGESAPRALDLDTLPRPSYDDWLAQLDACAPAIPRSELELPFETSRGCWYGEKHHCTFCGLNGESMTFRRKSPARALDELRDLGRYGIDSYYAVDLILDHRAFDTFLPALAREGLGKNLFYETKSNLSRRDVAALRDANIRMIQPGIESLSTPLLALMKKGVTALQNVRLLKWAAEHDITVLWALLYGFPGEPAEEYHRMAALIPSITHLAPPLGGYEVRADRFSPLYASDLPKRPSPAYSLAHGVREDVIERLAYHFHLTHEGPPRDYLAPLSDALRAWREQKGRSSFTSVDRGGALSLFDKRPVASVAQAALTGEERLVYLGCDAGATASSLAASLGVDERRVTSILQSFVERRWALLLDGRFLSLAVPMDAALPADLSRAALPLVAHLYHTKRMTSRERGLAREGG